MAERLRDRPALLATGTAAAGLYGLEVARSGVTAAHVPALLVSLASVAAAVALARTAPAIGLAVFGAGYTLQTAVTGLVDSIVVLAVWTLLLGACALWSAGPHVVLGAAFGLIPLGVFAVDRGELSPSSLALWSVPLLAGHAVRRRQERHGMEVALLRAEAARDAAAERARLAGDVHDLLGHALTSIVVQARGAAELLPDGADEARAALERVEGVGRDALAELRTVVLRLEAGEAAAPAPTHGLASLGALVGRMPLETELEVSPEADDADTVVQACAYRIVQESLTNVVRHSSATEVKVSVRRSGADLLVHVLDPGPAVGGASRGSGRGLDGMARRVTELGGRLTAGRDGDGWAVHAVIPVQVAA